MHRSGKVLVFVVLVVIVGVVGIVMFMQSAAGPGGVGAHVEDYIALVDRAAPLAESDTAQFQGPAVMVNMVETTIDDLQQKLPREWRAEMHDDVKLVIALYRSGSGTTASVGVPGMGVSGQGADYNLQVVLVDVESAQVLARHAAKSSSSASGGGMDLGLKQEAEADAMKWIREQLGF